MLIGPDPAPALRALDLTTAEVIVSGGVGTANDIAVLTEHRSQTGRAIDGVIVGRALYEGALAIDDAFAAARSADG
jgi:phosphoribosylformimino-5-aminoimidazole carboxamide ribonucleotide (ProFAR) isomerase